MPRSSLLPLLGLLLLAGFGAPLAGGGVLRADDATPKFLLERIVVEGLRKNGADRVVVAESRLREGEGYTEDELRQAVYRIKRLPFVLDAEFVLRKGSERGRYELVIGVEEVKPYFLQYTAAYDLSARPHVPGLDRQRLSDTGVVGLRYFVNAHDQAFAAYDPDGVVNLGYTRFNLFGHGGYASVQSSIVRGSDDRNLALTLTIPVAGNHAVRSTTFWSDGDFEHGWTENLAWLYNTTDDPLLPTEGIEAAASANYRQGRVLRITVFPSGERQDFDGFSWSAASSVRRHWAVSARQSVSAGASLSFERTRSDAFLFATPARDRRDLYGGSVEVGHAVNLWRSRALGPRQDLRLESTVTYAEDRSDPSGFFFRSHSLAGSLGLVFRNAWSLVRLGFEYARALGGHR
jgi:hypothetical protein